MIVGFDYWQVVSHYPLHIGNLMRLLQLQSFKEHEFEVHVVSAVGHNRVGTVQTAVYKALLDAGWLYPHELVAIDNIHEVVFDNPRQSPELKLAKCQELGIDLFFDDRDDVCRLLNKHGIMACRVTRKDNSTYDLGAEQS